MRKLAVSQKSNFSMSLSAARLRLFLSSFCSAFSISAAIVFPSSGAVALTIFKRKDEQLASGSLSALVKAFSILRVNIIAPNESVSDTSIATDSGESLAKKSDSLRVYLSFRHKDLNKFSATVSPEDFITL